MRHRQTYRQTDRQDKFVIDIYIYIYVFVYIYIYIYIYMYIYIYIYIYIFVCFYDGEYLVYMSICDSESVVVCLIKSVRRKVVRLR